MGRAENIEGRILTKRFRDAEAANQVAQRSRSQQDRENSERVCAIVFADGKT